MDDNIYKMPSAADRGFFRVDGELYLYIHEIKAEKEGGAATGVFVPTFAQNESDIVSLSIDAFREQLLNEEPFEHKDHLLKMQQLMAMIKVYVDSELLGKKHKTFRRVTVNISGSGMKYMADAPLEKDTMVRVALFFPIYPFKYVSVIGKVVRSEPVEGKWQIKLRFHEIGDQCQDDILRFVNQCQRQNRNK